MTGTVGLLFFISFLVAACLLATVADANSESPAPPALDGPGWTLENVGLDPIPNALPLDACTKLIEVCNAQGWATEADSIDGYNVQGLQVVHHGKVVNAAAHAVIAPYLDNLTAWLDAKWGHDPLNYNELDWVFARKYAADSPRDGLQGHKDSNRRSVNIALNTHPDFEGGHYYAVPPVSPLGQLVDAMGTKKLRRMTRDSVSMLKPANVPTPGVDSGNYFFPKLIAGNALVHNDTVWHGITPVLRNAKYTLVLFYDEPATIPNSAAARRLRAADPEAYKERYAQPRVRFRNMLPAWAADAVSLHWLKPEIYEWLFTATGFEHVRMPRTQAQLDAWAAAVIAGAVKSGEDTHVIADPWNLQEAINTYVGHIFAAVDRATDRPLKFWVVEIPVHTGTQTFVLEPGDLPAGWLEAYLAGSVVDYWDGREAGVQGTRARRRPLGAANDGNAECIASNVIPAKSMEDSRTTPKAITAAHGLAETNCGVGAFDMTVSAQGVMLPRNYFATLNKQLRLDRGVPWNERRTRIAPEHYLADLAKLIPTLQDSMAEQWAHLRTDGYKMKYPNRRDLPPTRFQRRGNFFMASPHKIQHDAEQLRFLVDTGRLPAAFSALSGAYRQLLGAMRAQEDSAGDTPTVEGRARYMMLTTEQIAAVHGSYNHLIFLQQHPSMRVGCALNPRVNWSAVEEEYFSHEPGHELVFVDNMLSPEALHALLDFCLESTIYFDVKRGYLGAYYFDGFNHPVLTQIIEELAVLMPNIFAHLTLTNMWSFKHDQDFSGALPVHADQAAVNFNFYLTPDDANLDLDSGGMVVYKTDAPLDWDFAQYNRYESAPAMHDFIRQSRADRIKIPYRQNRLVIFHSNLLRQSTFCRNVSQ